MHTDMVYWDVPSRKHGIVDKFGWRRLRDGFVHRERTGGTIEVVSAS